MKKLIVLRYYMIDDSKFLESDYKRTSYERLITQVKILLKNDFLPTSIGQYSEAKEGNYFIILLEHNFLVNEFCIDRLLQMGITVLLGFNNKTTNSNTPFNNAPLLNETDIKNMFSDIKSRNLSLFASIDLDSVFNEIEDFINSHHFKVTTSDILELIPASRFPEVQYFLKTDSQAVNIGELTKIIHTYSTNHLGDLEFSKELEYIKNFKPSIFSRLFKKTPKLINLT